MRLMKSTIVLLAIAASTPSSAAAQTAQPETPPTFSELALRLPIPASIIVTDRRGHQIRGELTGIEGGTLSLWRAGRSITVAENDVQRLQRRMPDSVLNGGFIGFAIGMAGPLIVCTSIGDNSETPACVAGSLGFGGLPGFAIGAIIDRLRSRNVTLFRR